MPLIVSAIHQNKRSEENLAIRHEIILSTTEPNNETGLIKVRQADEATQKLIVQISENGARKPYAGLQAFFCGKIGQSDGLGIIEQKLTEEEMTDPEIGRLEYTFRAEDWQKVGRQIGYFSFRKMVDEHTFEEQFTTRDFYYVVTKSIFSEGVREARNDGSTYIWSIEDMLRLFKEYISSGTDYWDRFIEQNKDIIESIDPSGKVLSELADARKTFDSLAERFEDVDNTVDKKASKDELEKISKDVDDTMKEIDNKQQALQQGISYTPDGTQNSVNYIAHRGNNADYPENSIRSFESVTRHWGIETDISVTKDGRWVIMHDSTVDRMTNGSGNIADMTFEQIRKLKIDSGKNVGKLKADELKVPTLEEYLSICRRNSVVPVIEIKKATYQAKDYDSLVEILERFNIVKGCVIISYYYEALQEVKKRLPSINVQLLINEITDQNLKEAQALGINSGISTKYSHASFNESNVRKAHNLGLSVCAYTVPDNKFNDVLNTGVDFITTDSKSGNRRFATLTPLNGFKADNVDQISAPFVEEKEAGRVQLYFGVKEGKNERFTVLFNLPDWAIPLHNQWNPCTIREKSTISSNASFDIIGRSAPRNAKAGDVRVSYNWEDRDKWAHGNVEYTLY